MTEFELRHTPISRPGSRWRLRTIALFAAPMLASGCATFAGGQSAELAAAIAAEEAAQQKVALLEGQLGQLQAEKAALEKRLAAAARSADAMEADAEAKSEALAEALADDEATTEIAQAAPPPAPKPVAPERVIAAADANVALRDAPEKPVQTAPRLVQPTFASEQDVFENEADTSIATSSVLYGVHLASYKHIEDARAGWKKLQQENPDELGLLEPRIETIELEGRGEFLRLIGGALASDEKAQALCAKLKTRGAFCAVTHFGGERLALVERES